MVSIYKIHIYGVLQKDESFTKNFSIVKISYIKSVFGTNLFIKILFFNDFSIILEKTQL